MPSGSSSASTWATDSYSYRSTSPEFTDSSNTATRASTNVPSAPSTPPEIPTATALRQHLAGMPELNVAPFHGDLEDESPRDFVNKMKRYFALGSARDEPDAHKIDVFEWSLKDGGAAAEWFRTLPADSKATWRALLAAFDERWPEKHVVAKTSNEKQEDLAEAKLKEDELGRKVKVNGVEMYSHVAWANRVERLAKAIPDNDNLLVRGTRNSMPAPLKALIPASINTWTAFCNAIRTVDITELKEKREERERTRKLEEEVQQLRNARNPPATPSKALAATLSRVQLGSPIPAPVFGQPKAATNTPGTQTQGGQAPGRTDAEKWVIIQRLPRPGPNTDAGRTAYQTAVTQWHAAYPRANAANEDRPYPLTPGTVALGSSECTGCGQLGHVESACTAATRVPQLESRWRRKVDSIRRAVNAQPAQVHVVDAVEDLPANITREQLHAWVDAYLLERDGPGKEEGSSD
ncbi:hypothetical protein H0H92_008484 [Tricholoma furcatifolium]|nr:hypothetical protein H0H92_008484 [Tricholoma furcatifolium]